MTDHTTFERVVNHLFSRDDIQAFIRLWVLEDMTVYQAERQAGLSKNTGNKHANKYNAHIEYLHSLGLGDLPKGTKGAKA